MTWYAGLQLVLAAVVVYIVVERMRTLLFVAPLDTRPWLRALTAALADSDTEAARSLATRAKPAWVGRAAELALRDDPEATGELDELLTDCKYEAFRRLRALRILASMGTASGFLGAVIEIIWLFEGDHGLAALSAGRVERIALEAAILAIALGIAISVFAFVSLGVLKKAALTLVTDLGKTVEALSR